jgi:hypothetical protein
VSSARTGAALALTGSVFRGRELLPSPITTTDGIGQVFAVLPLLSAQAVIGHVLIEYTAQHAFTCGAISEAISIAVRNFRDPSAPAS